VALVSRYVSYRGKMYRCSPNNNENNKTGKVTVYKQREPLLNKTNIRGSAVT